MRRTGTIARIAGGSLAMGAALLAASATARAADDEEGPRVVAHPTPPGPVIDAGVRRPSSRTSACSFRHPVCVHGDATAPVLAALASEERAWDVATGALALPAPLPSIDTRAYDVYLVDGPSGASEGATYGERDGLARVDRASAFTILDARLTGVALDATIARELTRASIFAVSPATDEGSARAESAYLARLIVPSWLGAIDGADDFQASPDRALVDTVPDWDPRVGARFDRGAALFPWWLDAHFSTEPAGLVRALWALSPTVTPVDAYRWAGAPDGFDVLRRTFKDALSRSSTVDDLFADFGVTRALMGSREDGSSLPEARALGAAIAPRIEWSVDWPARPRRLLSSRGVAPTGSAYVVVRRAGAAKGSRLRVEIEWEEHARMRWFAVKLDAAGKPRGRVAITGMDRATQAQGTIAELDDTDAILLAGTNVGDPSVPFDPDDDVWEPHGWLVTIASE